MAEMRRVAGAVGLVAAVCLAATESRLLAQPTAVVRRPTGKGAAQATAAAGAPNTLKDLLAAQQRVMEGGDAAAIAEATRPLAAAALREMAAIRRGQGKIAEAVTLESKAATVSGTGGAQPAGEKSGPGGRSAQSMPEPETRSVLINAFNDLGTAQARQGEYAAALQDFQEAERWGKPAPALLRNIGVAAFRLEDYRESGRALGAYVAEAPNDAGAQVMLGMSEFSRGSFAEAATHFAAAPAATLQDARAGYAWAFSLAHSRQQQQANEITGKLIEGPLPAEALSLICHVYMDTEAYEQSAACYRKAYAEDPRMKLAHYQAGESLLRLDRPAEAVPELRQELVVSPGDPNVTYSLAYALLQISQKEEARRLLEEVLGTDPSNAQAQYQLGKLQMEAGEMAEAIRHLEAAELNAPAADYIHYQLQLAYRKVGRGAEADRELRLYREIKAKGRSGGRDQGQ